MEFSKYNWTHRERFRTANLSNISGLFYNISRKTIVDIVNLINRRENANFSLATNYQMEFITYYLMGISVMLICGLGIIFNFLSILVLVQPNLRFMNTYRFQVAVVISDTLVLIFTILTAIKDTKYPQEEYRLWQMWQCEGCHHVLYIFLVCHPFSIIFQVSSVWLTVAFTTDRYLMICHPFCAQRVCTPKRAVSIIIAVFCLSIVYNLPRFFENQLWEMEIPDSDQFPLPSTNQTRHTTRFVWYAVSSFGQSTIFKTYYHMCSWIVLVVAGPLISIAIMNSFLIREVHQSAQRGRKINAVDRRRHDTNVMLISVIILFFICQLPAAVSHVMWGLMPKDDSAGAFGMTLFALNETGNLMVIVNSAINIVPYYFFGKKFRAEFIRLLCPASCHSNDRLDNMLMVTIDESKQPPVSGVTTNFAKRPCGGHHSTQASPLLKSEGNDSNRQQHSHSVPYEAKSGNEVTNGLLSHPEDQNRSNSLVVLYTSNHSAQL